MCKNLNESFEFVKKCVKICVCAVIASEHSERGNPQNRKQIKFDRLPRFDFVKSRNDEFIAFLSAD